MASTYAPGVDAVTVATRTPSGLRSVLQLHDADTGRLLAVMDAGHLQGLRASLTSALAADVLARDGIEVEVVDPRTLVPLDKEMILTSIAKTKRAVIVQEANRRGGVASDICSIIQEELFYDLDAPVEIVAGLDIPIPFNLTLEKASVPQKGDVVAAACRALHRDPLGIAAE